MAPKEEYIAIANQRALEKKTHVTFPQLKYPSLRDTGIKDSVQWLTGKAMDDGAEGLWRVHNGLYDLDSFLSKHPGGAEWLELTQGTDITEAYESHHLNTSAVDKILAKYYVRDATTPRNSPFTFDDNGFYRTLKRVVMEELPKVPKDLHKKTDRIIDGFFVSYLLSSAFSCYTKDPMLANLSWIIASLTLTWTMAASHNYIHKRSNWRMHLFSLGLWSYRDFRVSHALSHHLYPNTLMDLEISSFEPLVFWNPRKDKPITRYFAFFIEVLYYPLTFIIYFLQRSLSAIFRKDYFKKHWHMTDMVGLLVPVWMWLVTGTTFWHAFYSWLWILCTASLIFYKIATTAAHHHPEIWKDGDQPSYMSETPDWGVHQVEAVMDRKEINSSNHFIIMAFFGNHALHHMFPTFDHATLTYLYPVCIEVAKKFRTSFRATSQLDLFIGQYMCAANTEFKIRDVADSKED